MSELSFAKLQRDGADILTEAGVEQASLDARILLSHAANIPYYALISMAKDIVPDNVNATFKSLIQARVLGKPVYRIIGKREFFGREYNVYDNVLDPRPETEMLVERVLKDYHEKTAKFCEIGIGSGVISISLLCEADKLSAISTDISDDAILASTTNAKKHDVLDRLKIVKTDCLASINDTFDFVVSNPPYIDSNDMASLQKEVRDYDPSLALDGGKLGLEFYTRILNDAKTVLKSKGKLYLETGHGQHEALIALGKQMGWGFVSSHLDLSGLERIVVFEK